jgi:hypothetical protein
VSRFISSRIGLSDDDVQSLAPAHAKIVKSLAGRVRLLAELATGQSIIDGEPPMAPPNPDRDSCGVNFTGPPWGSAWLHPLWWRGGTRLSGTVEGGSVTIASEVGDGTINAPLTVRGRFTLRNFATSATAPYSRGYLIVVANQASAVSSFDVSVSLRSQGQTRYGEFSLASTTASIRTISGVDGGAVPYYSLVPGRNDIEAIFDPQASEIARIVGVAVCCIKKRTH